MASSLAEVWNSRRIIQGVDKVTVVTLWRAARADFKQGANGWTVEGMPTIGAALTTDASPAGSSLSWTNYSTPTCVGVDQNPRFTTASGYIRATYVGQRLWEA